MSVGRQRRGEKREDAQGHDVAEHLGVRGGGDARIDVRARAEVVEDTD